MAQKTLNNKNLSSAKKAKNDEFYTQYKDIEKELQHYEKHLSGKVVYCNCDNPETSNFFKFFATNFNKLQLKKVLATYFNAEGKVYGYELTKQLPVKGDTIDLSNVKKIGLKGNGSFNSAECQKYLKCSDIVVTNPPYSLFRDFIDCMFEHSKKFLIIGNANAITYKNCFSSIKDNQMWLGVNCVRWFYRPNGELCEGARSFWFTNLDMNKRHQKIELVKELSDGYSEYDNYKAIEVSRVVDIPRDYTGIMGVPVTFLSKYNPEQFEIIGATESEGKGFSNGLWNKKSGVAQALINGKRIYKRLFIQTV